MNVLASPDMPLALPAAEPVLPAVATAQTDPAPVLATEVATGGTPAFGEAWLRLMAGEGLGVDAAAGGDGGDASEVEGDAPTEDEAAAQAQPMPGALNILLPVMNAVLPVVRSADELVSGGGEPSEGGQASAVSAAPSRPVALPLNAVLAAQPTSMSMPAVMQGVVDASAGAADPIPSPAMPTSSAEREPGFAAGTAGVTPTPVSTEQKTVANLARGGEIPIPMATGEFAPRQADSVLKLPNGDATQWRQPLLQALGDRIQLQQGRAGESAVIRLEPPQMGRIEIAIRHEAGAITVSLSATHNEVLRQLQGIGESLRHDLSQRHQGEVSVQVGETAPRAAFADAGGGDGRQRGRHGEQADAQPGQALAEAETRFDATAFRLAAEQE